MQCEQPESCSINAAISPVKAPSAFSVAQFWAATLMFEPSSRSATLFKAVKTGAMITSQWFALATRGFRARAVETESPTVLYIFQFPAITGLRMKAVYRSQKSEVRSKFLFVSECCDPRQ